ncbi:MAG: T9SS C-terminal target domain-containing protein, partial [Flavobacterium sp.]
MKKLYFTVIAFFALANIQSQVINFTSTSFKTKLTHADYWNTIAKDLQGNYFKIDANNNGEIEQSEALQVSYLDFYGLNPAINGFDGIEYFTNLTFLNADANIATSGDFSALVNLETLYFTSPFMTSLNVSGLVNLKVLKCSGGQLTALDVSDSVNLEILHCGLNQIATIDLTGLVHLTELSVATNNLTALDVTGQPNLVLLECGDNQLTALDVSNQALVEILSCHNNPLGTLDISNLANLKTLLCTFNGLTSLDVSNSPLLNSIACGDNQLTSLSFVDLPNLGAISCNNNQLTSLELLGLPYLMSIDCSGNQLETLDLSEATSLQVFVCNNNQLTSLNTKNGIVEIGWVIHDNPNLAFICADEEMIQGIKDHIIGLELDCEVNSYCSFTPGGAFYSITGTNKFDTNNNGCDAEDIVYPNLKLALSNGELTGNMISDGSGNYNYTIQAGTYTLAPVFENPNYFTVTPASASITFPAETTTINQNFCITANEIHQDIDVNIIPLSPAIPGFDAHYKIIYRNIGNVAIAMGTVDLNYNDDALDFVSASPDTEVLPVGSLFWTFANLQPFETRTINLSFNLNSPMETPPLNGGDVLTFEASSQTSVG